jgi:hypothetical protein
LILGGAIWVAVAKARIKEGHNGEDVERNNEYAAVELEDTDLGNRSGEFEVGDIEQEPGDRQSGESHHRTKLHHNSDE